MKVSKTLACSQNKGLCPSQYQRRARQMPFRALPPQRQRGRCTRARAGRQGATAIWAPETEASAKLCTGSQLITMSSWDPGQFTLTRMVTA